MIHCGSALLWWGFLDLQQLLVGMELRVLEFTVHQGNSNIHLPPISSYSKK